MAKHKLLTFSTILALVTGIGTVFGMGFWTGMYYNDIQNKIERFRIEQDYQLKIQVEIDKCRDVKNLENKKTVEDMIKVVNELQKKVYGKK